MSDQDNRPMTGDTKVLQIGESTLQHVDDQGNALDSAIDGFGLDEIETLYSGQLYK